jgi:surface antigen
MIPIIRFPVLTLALCVLLATTGCASNPSNQQLGSIIGGILGGALVAHVSPQRGAEIVLGTLFGATIGGRIGQYMDEFDRTKVAWAVEHTGVNHVTSWKNPSSGHHYSVVPRRSRAFAGYKNCRGFNITVRIGNRREKLHGVACRLPDGSWQVQS